MDYGYDYIVNIEELKAKAFDYATKCCIDGIDPSVILNDLLTIKLVIRWIEWEKKE